MGVRSIWEKENVLCTNTKQDKREEDSQMFTELISK